LSLTPTADLMSVLLTLADSPTRCYSQLQWKPSGHIFQPAMQAIPRVRVYLHLGNTWPDLFIAFIDNADVSGRILRQLNLRGLPLTTRCACIRPLCSNRISFYPFRPLSKSMLGLSCPSLRALNSSFFRPMRPDPRCRTTATLRFSGGTPNLASVLTSRALHFSTRIRTPDKELTRQLCALSCLPSVSPNPS